ncbi:MAG: AAA family ATPase [Bacteroidales bacterium]|nr:AAA family ATPase [Bacteroidales bacterium]
MLKDFILSLFNKSFSGSFTQSQTNAIDSLSTFISDLDEHSLFILHGFAGTGKTTLISSIIEVLQLLKFNSVLLAPTGKAAKIISLYSNKPAFTIHKTIYRQKNNYSASGSFDLNFNTYSNTFFIVDEASMISDQEMPNAVFGSGRLLQDLMSFAYNNKNCRLILVGDTAQLPPVGLESGPALDKDYIERQFDKNVYYTSLTDVVRQAESSDILMNATQLRELIFSFTPQIPKFVVNNNSQIEAVSGNDAVNLIADSYAAVGIHDTIIITKSNKLANIYNNGIRNRILWHEEKISVGDYIMIVKNNYYWIKDNPKLAFIANGDTAKITSIKRFHELYNKTFASVTLFLTDYEIEFDAIILLDTLSSESAALTATESNDFFLAVMDDYADLKSKKEKYDAMKTNKYFNALQVKFAYAVTCHKAQGGQWKNVFIDHGYIKEVSPSVDMLKWFYTAITRSKEKIYFINLHQEFQ